MFDLFSLNLILVIGLGVFAFIAYRRLDLGLYLTIFSLPFYLIRLKISGIPTTVLELMIYILFLVFAIKSFLRVTHLKIDSRLSSNPLLQKKKIPLNPPGSTGLTTSFPKGETGGFLGKNSLQLRSFYSAKIKKLISENLKISHSILLFTGIILLFSGTMISTLLSSDKIVSGGILKGWFFDPFLLFLVIASIIKTSQGVKNIFYALGLSGASVAIISLVYWFLEKLTYDGRLYAIYLSPNHLAMYLAPSLIISYLLSSVSKTSKEKFSWLLVFLIILLPFYLTYSYGAWLGVAVALPFFIFRTQKVCLETLFFVIASDHRERSNLVFKPRMRLLRRLRLLAMTIVRQPSVSVTKILFYSIIFLLIVSFIYFQLPTEKFQNLLSLSRSSLESRLMIWQAALEMIKDHPLLGIGPGMFQKYYLDYQWQFPSYLEWAVPQPHNIFLAFWLQTGLVGLIGFILILIWFFQSGFQSIRRLYRYQDTDNITNRATSYKFQVSPKNNKLPTGQASFKFQVLCVSLMLYTLIHGLIDTLYWKNDLAAIFWIIIGLMTIISKEKTKYRPM